MMRPSKNVSIRMTDAQHRVMMRSLCSGPHLEQMLFCILESHVSNAGTLLLLRAVLLPGKGDLEDQSAVSVRPSRTFQRNAYDIASATGLTLGDIHTHTHPGWPTLSGIDTTHGAQNAKNIREHLGTGLAMLATSNDGAGFDGVYYTADGSRLRVGEIVIVGSSVRRLRRGGSTFVDAGAVPAGTPNQALPTPASKDRPVPADLLLAGRRPDHMQLWPSTQPTRVSNDKPAASHRDTAWGRLGRLRAGLTSWIRGMDPSSARFDRQQRIPGWDQGSLEHAKIAIVGLGGNGSQLLQLLVQAGAARKGHLVLIDHDRIEASNLNRSPYATITDIGCSKANVAAEYARRMNPDCQVEVINRRVESDEASRALWSSEIILGCGDNDGVRSILNRHALDATSIYIDLGCGVRVEDSGAHLGGQVVTVSPGQTGCLRCNGVYDPSQALAELDPAMRERRKSVGYVEGAHMSPQPAVVGLNTLAATIAFWRFLEVVGAVPVKWGDFVAFDAATGTLTKCALAENPHCRDCGNDESKEENPTEAAHSAKQWLTSPNNPAPCEGAPG